MNDSNSLMARLSLHHGLVGLSFGFISATQGLFILEKGYQAWHVGWMFGLFAVIAALAEVPLGAVADRWGRLFLFRLSLVVSILALSLAIVTTMTWLLIASVIFLALSQAMSSGTVDAWQVEQIRKQDPEALSLWLERYQSIGAVAIALGALMGGYMPTWLAFLDLSNPTAINFVACLSLRFLHWGLCVWLFQEGESSSAENKTSNPLSSAVGHCLQPVLLFILGVAFIFGLVLVAVESYWQPALKEINHGPGYEIFGWLGAGYFLVSALGPLLYQFLHKRLGLPLEQEILWILGIASGLLMLLSQQNETFGFASLFVIFMLVMSSLIVPASLLTHQHTPDSIRATVLSIKSLVMLIGSSVTTLGLSHLILSVGVSGVWFLVGVFGLVAAIALFVAWRLTLDLSRHPPQVSSSNP